MRNYKYWQMLQGINHFVMCCSEKIINQHPFINYILITAHPRMSSNTLILLHWKKTSMENNNQIYFSQNFVAKLNETYL